MPEEPLTSNDPAPAPVPQTPLSSEEPSSEQPVAPAAPTVSPSTSAEPLSPTPPQKPRKSKKKLFAGLLIVIVIIVAVVVALVIKADNNPNAKKDIPVLNYGNDDGGEVPQYPVTYLYVNADIDIALQLFEGLTGFQNQTKVVPLLATSWSNPNNTTWVFNLRHGVKFHDGDTMTAQDVKYTLDYAVAHQNANNGESTFLYTADDIKQVTVNNSYQVTITTTTPDAVLLSQLGLIGIVDSKAKLGSYDAGTGPYIVKPGTTPTSSSIDLVAFNNYWGGHVYTREVKISLYTNADQLTTDAAKGKVDLSGDYTVSQLAKIKPLKTVSVTSQGIDYIGLNTERAGSPLQSLAARQAVAYALNIPAIIKGEGYNAQQTSQIVPQLLPGHNPSIQNTPYDPAKAKQLLATVPNASAQIVFGYPQGIDPQVDETVKDLTAVGFNVKAVEVDDFGTYVNNAQAGQYDIYTEGDSSATVDGLDILTDLLTNNQDYDNPQIDSLITQAGSTLNSADRISDMQQIATIVAAQKPIIPLYIQNQVFVLTKPYVVTPNLPDLNDSIYFWQVYQK